MTIKSDSKVQYASVPLVLLGEGAIFHIVFQVCTCSSGNFGSAARFILALFLTPLGMFLLRKAPKRTLIVSSVIACAIILALNLLWLLVPNNQGFRTVLNILDFFQIVPNNIISPVASLFFDAASLTVTAAVLFTVAEILFPMIYSFSGGFVRIASKNTENK